MEIAESNFSRLSIGEDVNAKQNRIPLESELLTLRNLMAQNTSMSVHIESDLKSAKTGLGRIKERERRLLMELESTRSEMQASARFIDILENQYDVLQTDFGRLKGLVHPIRRCPPDILITIFKWLTVVEDADWCRTGITISHVCRQWRSIALDSPSLWSHIDIPRTDSVRRLKSFFKAMAYRLRSFAPEIRLRVWDDEVKQPTPVEASASLSLMMKASDLDRFSSVNLLSFSVPPPSIKHLANLGVQCQKPIKCIKIFSDAPSTGATVLDVTAFLKQFPVVTELEIHNVPDITLAGTETFESVTILQLLGVGTAHSFSSDAKRFSNLTELYLGATLFRGDTTNHDIILKKLKSLSVEKFDGIPWSRFNTPRLGRLLIFSLETVTNDVLEFLQRCRDLRHLLMPITKEKFSSLALAVQSVEILELYICYKGLYDWEVMGMTSQPFPHLRNFTFIARNSLTLPKFEKLVAARCHPPAQPDNPLSLLPLESLAIRYESKSKPFIEADLEEYPYLGRCILTYRQPPSYWADDWHECSLTWPTS